MGWAQWKARSQGGSGQLNLDQTKRCLTLPRLRPQEPPTHPGGLPCHLQLPEEVQAGGGLHLLGIDTAAQNTSRITGASTECHLPAAGLREAEAGSVAEKRRLGSPALYCPGAPTHQSSPSKVSLEEAPK